jgi:hypothetical protein
MTVKRTPDLPHAHSPIPPAAHRFTLLVSGLVWVAMIAFGLYVGIGALGRWSGAEGTRQAGLLLAAAASIAGGLALLSATYQDWRQDVRLNHNPRAMIGFACLAVAGLAVALLR